MTEESTLGAVRAFVKVAPRKVKFHGYIYQFRHVQQANGLHSSPAPNSIILKITVGLISIFPNVAYPPCTVIVLLAIDFENQFLGERTSCMLLKRENTWISFGISCISLIHVIENNVCVTFV